MEHNVHYWLVACKIVVFRMLCTVVSYINQGLPPAVDMKLFQNSPEGLVVPRINIPEQLHVWTLLFLVIRLFCWWTNLKHLSYYQRYSPMCYSISYSLKSSYL